MAYLNATLWMAVKLHTTSAVVACGLGFAALTLAAPVHGTPTGPGNALQTIQSLQAQGFNVIINRTGTAPLDQSSVIRIRPGQLFSRSDSGAPGAQMNPRTTVLSKTVYVDVR
jgi:hypothetical protein